MLYIVQHNYVCAKEKRPQVVNSTVDISVDFFRDLINLYLVRVFKHRNMPLHRSRRQTVALLVLRDVQTPIFMHILIWNPAGFRFLSISPGSSIPWIVMGTHRCIQYKSLCIDFGTYAIEAGSGPYLGSWHNWERKSVIGSWKFMIVHTLSVLLIELASWSRRMHCDEDYSSKTCILLVTICSRRAPSI